MINAKHYAHPMLEKHGIKPYAYRQAPTCKDYLVTKRFVGGLLKGITRAEFYPNYSKPPKEGLICRKPCGGTSPYVIVKVEEVPR